MEIDDGEKILVKAKTPRNRKWRRVPWPFSDATAYRLGNVLVLSEIHPMEAPDSSGDILLTWLVSVSERGRSMPSDTTMRRVRRAFQMEKAEEDNHESGMSRKLFLVVDAKRRVACECKTTERIIVREDGYKYSQPLADQVEG